MLTPQEFFYVRHGATDWNLQNRLQSFTDIPLNTEGLAQARAACLVFPSGRIDVLVSSPLSRAAETARIIAEAHNLPVVTDDRLKERSFGNWEGRLRADVAHDLGIGIHDDITPFLPGDAEKPDTTLRRMTEVINHHLNINPGKRVAFVGHGANFRILATALTGMPMSAKTGIPYRVAPTANSGWSIAAATQAEVA